ncbi:MAG TPA: hypothetical protein ENL02_05000, partial [Epsilonproteobacteria bacterium]|nr:hypothetical protein [Campylobacterota bacterium]
MAEELEGSFLLVLPALFEVAEDDDLFLIERFDGNISVRLKNGNILITPSGVSKGFMKAEKMVLVNEAGTVL